MGDREETVYMAKLAEQTGRYDKMRDCMKRVAQLSQVELTVEERNLFSMAYKNVIGSKRAEWRVLVAFENQEDKNLEGLLSYPGLVMNYKVEVEGELCEICEDILHLLEHNLIPSAQTAESKVFFFKMKGDYHRYIAEIKILPDESGLMLPDAESKDAKNSEEAYKKAQEIAATDLGSTHPIRLGLALNFSMFHFEIKRNPAEACKHAKDAFDAANADLDTLSEESYKDSTLIMQLLRENLTLWSNEDKGDTV